MRNTKVINVGWCSPHPNHYNNYLFENIGKLHNIDLELIFFQKKLIKYPWESNLQLPLKTTYLKKWLGVDWIWLVEQIFLYKGKYFVIAGWNNPTMIALLSCLSLLRRPFILYSDTPNTKKRAGIRNIARAIWLNFIFKRCTYFFVTGKPGIAAAKKIGIPIDKLVNFPFATNTSYFKPALTEKGEEVYIIASGRLDISHKGYDTALKALAICKKQDPTLKFKFAIAGTGPDEQKIQYFIHKYELEDEVTLVGWLEPHQLLEFYQSGTVLLHTSNFDPFPNAVLEAMACGLPVIASDMAGSALDRIEQGINGYLHKSGDPNDLATWINNFLKLSKEEQDQMGKQARLTAESWPVDYNVNMFEEKIYASAEN